VPDGGALVIHLLNYDQAPSGELKLKLVLGKDWKKLAGRKPILLSPDTPNTALKKVQWNGSTLEATVHYVDSYSVIVVQ
jgi:hypothetical protein